MWWMLFVLIYMQIVCSVFRVFGGTLSSVGEVEAENKRAKGIEIRELFAVSSGEFVPTRM